MGMMEKGMTLIELTIVLLILVALAGITVPYVSGTGSMAMCRATDATMQVVKEAIMGGGAGPGFYGDTLGYFPKVTKGTAADYNLKYLLTPLTDVSWGRMVSYNPKTALGWRGPYIQAGITNPYNVDADDDADLTDELHSSFASATYVDSAILLGDEVVLDGWRRPIILQVPTAGCTPYPADPIKCARIVSAGPIAGGNIQVNGFSATLINGDASDREDDRVLFLSIPDPDVDGNVDCGE